MLFAASNACNIRMWLRQQFFMHWEDNNISNKIKELTDLIDFAEFPSLCLEGRSVVTSI